MNLDFLRAGGTVSASARRALAHGAAGARRRRPLRGPRRLERRRRVPGRRRWRGATTVELGRRLASGQARAPGPSEAIDAAAAELPFGTAVRSDDAWWCRLTQTRALRRRQAPGDQRRRGPRRPGRHSNFAALTLVGPACARDVRALLRAGPPTAGHAGRRAAPGLGRRASRAWSSARTRSATCSCSGGPPANTCGGSSPTPAAHLGGRPVGADALREVAAANA